MNMSRLFFSFLLFLTCNFSTACKTMFGGGEDSGLKHTPGVFHVDGGAFANLAVPREDMTKFLEALYQLKQDQFIDQNHPLTKRLEIWLNELWEVMLEADPKLGEIPKPKVLLIRSESMKAFVVPAVRCINKKVKPAEKPSLQEASGPLEYIRFDRKENSLKPFKSMNFCLPHSGFKDLDHEEKTMQWLMSSSIECKDIKVTANEYIIPKDCAMLFNKEKTYLQESDKFVFFSTANWLNFHTKMLRQKEEYVVSVLAHELAHYVMSHPSVAKGSHDFLYRLSDKNPARRPIPDRTIPADMLQKIQKAQRSIRNIPTVQGQRFYTLVYNNFRSPRSTLSQLECLPGLDCIKVCGEFRSFLLQNGSALREVYRTPLARNSLSIYKEFEEKAVACTRLLPFTESWQTTFNRSVLTYVKLASPSIKAESLLEALDVFSDEMPRIIDEYNRPHLNVLQDAMKNRIGYYTTEQEADEIALESLLRIGLKKEHLIGVLEDVYELLADKKGVFASLGQLAPDLCRRSIESGEIIPLLDFQDTHHDGCFRLYNIFQESEAHKSYYENLKVDRQLPRFDKSWEEELEALN